MAAANGILLDLDGVLYNGEEVVPGAAEAVEWIRGHSISHLFLTNTTSRPRAALVEKLGRFGIQAEESSIWTPPLATLAWLHGRPAGKTALFVPEATRLELASLDLCEDAAESGADYVVVGDLGEEWDFATLNRAFRLLYNNPDAVLIALGMTRFWRSPSGIALDAAPFVAALEHAADRKAVVLGKPAIAFFEAAAAKLALRSEQLWMIGDDVRADVRGAQAAGIRGALVRTGKFRPSDLEGEIRPDAVLSSVAELPSRWDDIATRD